MFDSIETRNTIFDFNQYIYIHSFISKNETKYNINSLNLENLIEKTRFLLRKFSKRVCWKLG